MCSRAPRAGTYRGPTPDRLVPRGAGTLSCVVTRALNTLVRIALLLALGSLVLTIVGLAAAPQLADLSAAAKGTAGDV